MVEKLKKFSNKTILVIVGGLILIFIAIVYNYYLLKLKNESEIITINSTPSEIELFCKDLEEKLKAENIWGTDQWRCILAYDEGLPTKDIIYNKTRGLCNCTAILPNGETKNIEVRQSK